PASSSHVLMVTPGDFDGSGIRQAAMDAVLADLPYGFWITDSPSPPVVDVINGNDATSTRNFYLQHGPAEGVSSVGGSPSTQLVEVVVSTDNSLFARDVFTAEGWY